MMLSFCSSRRTVIRVCCTDAVTTTTRVPTTRPPTRVSTSSPTTTLRSSLLPVPGSEKCGLHTVDKIVGGNETAINEYPWLALLEFTWRKYCYQKFKPRP